MNVLLVANQTLGGAELAQHLSELHAADADLTLHVLVPAAVVGVIADPAEMLSLIAVDVEAERKDAADRLDTLLGWLHRGGVQATGEITVAQPLLAIATATRSRAFDEVVLSTFPPGVSRWLRMDLAHRVRRMCNLPVTTIVNASDGAGLPELASAPPSAAGRVEIVVVAAAPERRRMLVELVGSTVVPSSAVACATFAEALTALERPAAGERAVLVWPDEHDADALFSSIAELRGRHPEQTVAIAADRNHADRRALAHDLGVSFFVLSDDADANREMFGILASEFVALRQFPQLPEA